MLNYQVTHNYKTSIDSAFDRVIIEVIAELVLIAATLNNSSSLTGIVFNASNYASIFLGNLITNTFFKNANIYAKIAIVISLDEILYELFESITNNEEFVIEEEVIVKEILLYIIVFSSINNAIHDSKKSSKYSTFLLTLYGKYLEVISPEQAGGLNAEVF